MNSDIPFQGGDIIKVQAKLALLFHNPDAVLQKAGFFKTFEQRQFISNSFVEKCGGNEAAMLDLQIFIERLDLSALGNANEKLLKHLCIKNDGSAIFKLPNIVL